MKHFRYLTKAKCVSNMADCKQNQKPTELNNFSSLFFLKKNVHNYSSTQFETSLLQHKYAVMEPSRDLINLLIEGKEHFFHGQ